MIPTSAWDTRFGEGAEPTSCTLVVLKFSHYKPRTNARNLLAPLDGDKRKMPAGFQIWIPKTPWEQARNAEFRAKINATRDLLAHADLDDANLRINWKTTGPQGSGELGRAINYAGKTHEATLYLQKLSDVRVEPAMTIDALADAVRGGSY